MPGETFRVNRRDQLKWFGIILAIIVGCILGNSLTPYVLWIQSCRVNANESNGILSDCNPLDFLFSQTIGIYVASTGKYYMLRSIKLLKLVAFLIYSTFHKFANRSMPRSALRPAYISGLMWGIGLAGQLVAAGIYLPLMYCYLYIFRKLRLYTSVSAYFNWPRDGLCFVVVLLFS